MPPLSPENSVALIYRVCLVMPWLAFALLAWAWIRGRSDRVEMSRIMSLAVLCLLVGIFILRVPIEARVGGAAPPMVVLGAWVVASFIGRSRDEPAHTTAGRRRGWSVGRRVHAGSLLRFTVVTLALAILGYSATTFTPWAARFRAAQVPLNPVGLVETLGQNLSRQLDELVDWNSGRLHGLAEYVRHCTRPADRVLAVGGFMPELPFLAGRPFAGGILVSLQWPAPRFEEWVLNRLRQDPPRIVVVSVPSYPIFQEAYTLVEDYFRANYRSAGESSFASQSPYAPFRILVERDAVTTLTDDRFPIRCFR